MTYPSFLQEHMPERSVEVGDFRVPKFKISFYSGMKRQLQDLGIKAVVDPARADLSECFWCAMAAAAMETPERRGWFSTTSSTGR